MTIAWLIILAGAFLLYIGAELLVRSSLQIALHFKLSKLIIGLTIVAFATSAPEAITSVIGQIKGAQGDIALGNVIGSNIANVGLVLGFYLMIRPCDVTHEMKWHKMPFLFLVYLLMFLVMIGGKISGMEGIFLFLAMILYIVLQFFLPPKKEILEEEIKIYDEVKPPPMKITLQILGVIGSVALMILGSKFLIDGALKIANILGISERIIAISIVALGTSLPEVATALVAAFRKEQEIIVGTIIGSNIFNPLLIIPCATIVKPIYFAPKMLLIDFPLMVAVSLLLWVLMVLGNNKLSRIDGAILLFSYASYITYLYL